MRGPLVLVDAENVRRSRWPNLSREELVERCRLWAEREGLSLEVVFDGRAPEGADEGSSVLLLVSSGDESADDVLARRAAGLRAAGEPFWLVTSDRALRAAAGPGAERVLGGGAFVRSLEVR